MQHERRYETAEHVLPGHPDKLCDAAVDGIVDALRQLDPKAQCGLEMACVFNEVVLTGRIAACEKAITKFQEQGGCKPLIRKAYQNAGYGTDEGGMDWKPFSGELSIREHLCLGPFEEEERDLRHLSDDQAICVGYASADAGIDHLPPAVWLARRIARKLVELRSEIALGHVGPDGKVLVRVENGGRRWKPVHVSLSLSHHVQSDWLMLRRLGEAAVETACSGHSTPEVSLNRAGMFISVGPNGDNGLSGKKLVVDAYGPGVPIGGGAWSGKDFHKVDRLGGLLARKLARQCVTPGRDQDALVTLEYHPGAEAPNIVGVRIAGQPCTDALSSLLPRDLSNSMVWASFKECPVPLPELALWGHQQSDMPWENE